MGMSTGVATVMIAIYALFKALICAIPASLLISLAVKVTYAPLVREKKVQKAIAKGNVVRAKFAEYTSMYPMPNGKWEGLYEYQYGGKTYKYRGVAYGALPDEITLYFETRPERATVRSQMGYRESRFWKYFWWVLLAIFIVFFIKELNTYAGQM